MCHWYKHFNHFHYIDENSEAYWGQHVTEELLGTQEPCSVEAQKLPVLATHFSAIGTHSHAGRTLYR